MSTKIKPFVFVILSGWGIAPASSANAISLAKTPNFDRLATNYKTLSLEAAGNAVGLLDDEPGNSKTSYLNIGAGKVVYEILPKINVAIKDRSFFDNPVLISAIENCLENNSALHLMGQISEKNEHSSVNHLYALIDLARSKGVEKIYLHLFLDGITTDKKDGLNQLEKIQEHLNGIGVGKIATIHGQNYAMNRDGFWDKTEKSYRAIVEGKSESSSVNALKLIEQSYASEVYDDEMVPVVVTDGGKVVGKISDHDSIIGFNFRADRMRQLACPFIDAEFNKFKLKKLSGIKFVGMIRYCSDFAMEFAFDKDEVKVALPFILEEKHINQTYLAEGDKYIQLISFLKGNIDKELSLAKNLILPEDNIPKAIVHAIVDEKSEFVATNFSLADKEAGEGDLKKTIKAIEKIDSYLGKITDAVIEKQGVVLITADHGNIEEFSNLQNGAIEKENSTNPVPLILVGERWGQDKELGEGKIDLSLIKPTGALSDIAPTILKILGIKKPKEMTGKSLI
ncbi:MAG: 2,3-bisphosphoglycerate-independent phosphoglycerate mutase [Patescibacteria group bacterium]